MRRWQRSNNWRACIQRITLKVTDKLLRLLDRLRWVRIPQCSHLHRMPHCAWLKRLCWLSIWFLRIICFALPPRHHAIGFCFFNNVAHAIEHHFIQRVAILDFDVHHGNGSEEIFRANPHVMLCSTFQHPFYPYCGADSGNERMINTPCHAAAMAGFSAKQ